MEVTEREKVVYSTKNEGRKKYTKKVNIHGLKLWAEQNLPKASHIRSILQLEKDSLTVEEFVVKMDIWIKLIDIEAIQ